MEAVDINPLKVPPNVRTLLVADLLEFVKVHDLCADEAALEIAVDGAGSLGDGWGKEVGNDM